MKGVSAVIAVILLLLISIAVIGFTAVFLTGTVETTQEQTEGATSIVTGNVQKLIRFVDASGTDITIKNAGTADITGAELTFLVGGSPATCTPPITTVSAGQAVTCSTACNSGLSITITAPGNTVTDTCPA